MEGGQVRYFDEYALLYFSLAATAGILLLDLWLMIFNKQNGRFLTLSRAYGQLPWYVRTAIIAAICWLIWHLEP